MSSCPKTRKAVILAAGLGSRIAIHTKNHPKGFIKVGGMTLIERSLAILRTCGIEEVVIVTGHLAEWYESLSNRIPNVRCVRNKDFKRSGSLHSLCILEQELTEDFILLESDLIFEKRAVQNLLGLSHEAILISGQTHSSDEVYVEVENGFMKWLSKDKASVSNVAGEFVGINRLSLETFQELCRWAKQQRVQPTTLHYEEGLAGLYPTVKIPVHKIENLVWAEVDTEDHLLRVEEKIFPALMGCET